MCECLCFKFSRKSLGSVPKNVNIEYRKLINKVHRYITRCAQRREGGKAASLSPAYLYHQL